jgi:hypothetical protein
MAQRPDYEILGVCPPGFDNTALLSAILVGGVIFVLVTFGREIMEFVGKKLESNSS